MDPEDRELFEELVSNLETVIGGCSVDEYARAIIAVRKGRDRLAELKANNP